MWLAVCAGNATFATAGTSTRSLQIKILSAEYHAIDGGTPVPRDCDLQNFSAYCNESANPTLQNVMRVQDNNGKTFTITCMVDSRFSRCAELPVGQTYQAREDKHGITVIYEDAKGKERKELYQVVAANAAPAASAAPSAPRQSATVSTQPSAPAAAAPARGAASPSGAVQAVTQPMAVSGGEKVRCAFTTNPAGAEITLDGKYVGSTPSEIAVSTGTHEVLFSMPGFAPWKRELTVTAGSELTVSAILQKASQ